MNLTLIIGPMKSGKSYDLISYFAPLRYSNTPFALFQPARNVRDQKIISRNGAELEAKKITSLSEITLTDEKVIGIDEVHMFAPEDISCLATLMKRGTAVIASGLDLDYQGKLFKSIERLFELVPTEVRYRRAVCDTCRAVTAVYSQVLRNNIPVTSGTPPVIPDDGTFTYQAACRNCFVRDTSETS